MDEETKTIETLMKELLNMRGDYSKGSESYINRVRLLVAQFKTTHDDGQMKEVYRLYDEHKKFTQTYQKKVTNLHKKISYAMQNIA